MFKSTIYYRATACMEDLRIDWGYGEACIWSSPYPGAHQIQCVSALWRCEALPCTHQPPKNTSKYLWRYTVVVLSSQGAGKQQSACPSVSGLQKVWRTAKCMGEQPLVSPLHLQLPMKRGGGNYCEVSKDHWRLQMFQEVFHNEALQRYAFSRVMFEALRLLLKCIFRCDYLHPCFLEYFKGSWSASNSRPSSVIFSSDTRAFISRSTH